jgi:prepilin-type N-terminal cleavage/methylation domain-containing protein/prepilin-type processing-associated H-X9-DG protein
MRKTPSRRRRAFTLVELLVVVAIIGVMVGMLLPAIQQVRARVNRINCKNNLHNIGLAVWMYVDANGRQFPNACEMKTQNPGNLPTIAAALSGQTENSAKVWRCPSDPTYFQQQDTSYDYPAGTYSFNDLPTVTRGGARPTSTLFLMYDFSSFHGPAGNPLSINVLYLDGHVQ